MSPRLRCVISHVISICISRLQLRPIRGAAGKVSEGAAQEGSVSGL